MRHAKLSLILVAAFLAAAYVAYHHPHLVRAQASQSNKVACCGTNAQVGPREIDFPYYSLRDGFSSKLLLVSDSPHSIDLNVAVRGLLGETVLVPMSIQSQEKLTIDVAKLLAKQGADVTGAFAEGSIAVYFIGTIMPVVGQLTMTNPATHLIHESEMVENDPGRSDIPAILNGLWWNISPGRDARIMVSNTSGNAVTADVFLDFAGKRHPVAPLMFSPHETKVLSITQLLGSLAAGPADAPEGGITIIQHEPHPSLIAQGKVLDPVTGFSTTLEFPDPARQPASALHAVGLPIGTPSKDSPYAGAGFFTPHVIARNLSGAAQTVTVTVEYPKGSTWNSAEGPGGSAIPHVRVPAYHRHDSAAPVSQETTAAKPPIQAGDLTGQMTLASLPVGPYATVDYSLDAAMSELPLPLAFCSIRIQYSGAPGSMIAQASSVDHRQDLVVEARTMNEADGWAGSGANPWHLDDQTQSFLFLTDESDKPARIGFSVTASGTHYYLTTLKLAPHETRMIDLRTLRDAQQVDFKKNKLPAGATDGSVSWIRLDNVAVTGRVVVIARHNGMASSYDCCTCLCPGDYSIGGPAYQVTVNPADTGVKTGASVQLTATALYFDCNNSAVYFDVTSGATWSSENRSVATVYAGKVTGGAQGSTNIDVEATDCQWSYDPNTFQCDCTYASEDGSAFVVVNTPVPVNFDQNTSSAPAGGILKFGYVWGSSTGNLGDLSNCKVGEQVYYPGGDPYVWPEPPWSASTRNPTTDISIGGTQGWLVDQHTPGKFVTPYGAANFQATQNYAYQCTGVNNGNPVVLDRGISISRSVTKNPNGTFTYHVAKSGASNSCTLGQDCSQ